MKRSDSKSHCPINFSLETFGDPWSLLIIRDIIYFGKKTYGEFLDSEERIATNMLAVRLAQLEQRGILAKQPHNTDKRKEVYTLTEKGIALVPILLEMANWSARFDAETTTPSAWITAVNRRKEVAISAITAAVKRGGSVFVGPNNVASRLIK